MTKQTNLLTFELPDMVNTIMLTWTIDKVHFCIDESLCISTYVINVVVSSPFFVIPFKSSKCTGFSL